jgi:hypothetical protein
LVPSIEIRPVFHYVGVLGEIESGEHILFNEQDRQADRLMARWSSAISLDHLGARSSDSSSIISWPSALG